MIAGTSVMSDAAPADSRVTALEVLEVIRETSDALSLVLAVADAEHTPLSYQPGQFLTLRIPRDDGGALARCYSLASSPLGAENPKVTVKRVPGGYGSSWLCDNARAGMRLTALPPAGTFVPRSLDADLLLIAGGSGITPIIAILKSAMLGGHGHVVLIYANHDASSVIFASELRELAKANPHRLQVIHWLTSKRGRLTREQMQLLTSPIAPTRLLSVGRMD